MKHLICCLLLVLATHHLSAQSLNLSPEVVASAGDRFSSSTINMDWTLGELMIESYVGTIVLTQGFHQPGLRTTSIKDHTADLAGIKVYPNPTSGSLSIERDKSGDLELSVWDMQGRIVLHKNVSTATSHLDLVHLPSGIYMLRMSVDGQAAQSIRIKKL